jgi:spermidine synthase
MNRLAAALPVLALGFFAMFSQAPLFREHLLAGGVGDPGVAVFLGCWLFWVAAGSGLHALWRPRPSLFAPLLLLYFALAIPVALLLWNLRHFAGLTPMQPLGLPLLLLHSLVALAPLPLLGGLLLPLAARHYQDHPLFAAHPGATTYALEVSGAVLGGATVTWAQHLGLSSLVLLPAGVVFALALALPLVSPRGARGVASLLALPLLAAHLYLLAAPGQDLLQQRRLSFVPAPLATAPLESRDSFYSNWTVQPQQPQGLLVYRDGRLFHRYPEELDTHLTAAALLAQSPQADTALILGFGGEELVCRLLESGLSKVWLLGADPVFASFVGPRLGPDLLACLQDPRVQVLVGEPLQSLDAIPPASLDLLVLNVGDPDGAAAARFFLPPFLNRLAGLLRPEGLLHLSISSTETQLGGQALAYARAVKASLSAVFPFVVVGAGERLPFFAARVPLGTDPETLKERFLTRPRRPDISPDALFLLFEEGPVQRRTTALADTTGANPAAGTLGRLHSLLAAEATGSRALAALWDLTPLLALLFGLLPFVLLWVFALPAGGAGATRLQGLLLLLFAGSSALLLNLVLLLSYQFRWGSLPVDFGLLNALFMLGLALASLLLRLAKRGGRGEGWLSVQVASLLALLAVPLVALVLHGGDGPLARLAHGGALLACGLLLGLPVPLLASPGALGQRWQGRELALGSALDHLGGLLGAFLGGLLFLPVLGLNGAVALCLAPLLATALAGLPPHLPGGRFLARANPPSPLPGVLRVLLLLAVAAAAYQGWLNTRPAPSKEALRALPQALVPAAAVPGATPGQSSVPAAPAQPQWVTRTSPVLHRCLQRADGGCEALRLSSASAVPQVEGFGGRLSVQLELGPDGLIRTLALESHSETPSYITRIGPWMKSLEGQQARGIHLPGRPGDGPEVQGMTGATISSNAVLRAVDGSAKALLPPAPPANPNIPKTITTTNTLTITPHPNTPNTNTITPKPNTPNTQAAGDPRDLDTGPPPNQRARNADLGQLKPRLEAGELSDREALYYHREPR